MDRPLNLRLSEKPSNSELVTKFNIISQKTDNNTQDISKVYGQISKMETNIIKTINESNKQINNRLSKLEIKDKMDDIKAESSLTHFFNIAGGNVLVKIIELMIMSGVIYAVTHIK